MRPLPLLLSALFVALPAAADTSYDGFDDHFRAFRRLFAPLELSLFLVADDEPVRTDPAMSFYDEAKKTRLRTAQMAALGALQQTPPNVDGAVRSVAEMRSILIVPALDSYLQSSVAPAASNAPLSGLETALFDSLKLHWYGSAPPTGAVEPSHVRALLRAEAAAHKASPPSGRIDHAAQLARTQGALRGVLTGDEAMLTSLYSHARMTRPAPRDGATADPRMSDPSDRAARLRTAMPEPRFSALERTILASVLTDAAFADVVSGRSTLDLKKEALDAANLAMADQADPAIVAAIREKTIFKPGSLAGLRTSIPPADMSRYVCGAMDRQQPQRAPPLVGGQGTARADLEASAAEADVIRVETTALPGIARYCQESAALRTAPADTRPVQPQQRMGRTDAPPGPATAGQNVTGRPTGGSGGPGGGIGGFLGGLWDGIKSNLPFMAGGALGGILVAAALGAGPVGLLAGLAVGAAFGGILGMLGGGKGGGS
jgi:hypothetical protein